MGNNLDKKMKESSVIYFSSSYLVGALFQSHLLKQFSYLLWGSSHSLWKQNSKLLNEFLLTGKKL